MKPFLLCLLAIALNAADPFQLVIKTDNPGTSTSTQFTLPLPAASVYNCTVAWGDGNSETVTGFGSQLTHTYTTAGTYTVSITENGVGGFSELAFNFQGDRRKLLAISQWGDVTWSSMRFAFSGCENMVITATDTPNTSTVTDFRQTWLGCTSLTSFPVIDTSAGTNFGSTWSGCSALTSFPC